MPLPKPSSKTLWTKTNPTVRVEPSGSKKNTGWAPNERPPAEYFNWLEYIVNEWIEYLESVTDSFIGYQSIYAAFVGTGGIATHADLNSAVTDVAAGSKILVVSSATINTPQLISKNRLTIEFLPNVIYTKGTSQYGLQVQADYCRILGGEFEGFSGGSDAAVRVDSGSDHTKIMGIHARTCTAAVEDNATTTVELGTTSET
jgi:hypothetical protein